jgi:nucleoside-diphosphate-sugar epimerase
MLGLPSSPSGAHVVIHEETILVLGATGQQGGSVATSLLQDGWRVRALVRDTGADKVRALEAQGVAPVAGDLSVSIRDHSVF